MKRRNFIKVGAAGLASPILLAGNKDMKVNKDNPIVISTWSHGIPANEASIKILENNGSALDAVEAGVRVTEADAENQSVGLGGRPDSEGNVTLDACIMDSDGNGRISTQEFVQGISCALLLKPFYERCRADFTESVRILEQSLPHWYTSMRVFFIATSFTTYLELM